LIGGLLYGEQWLLLFCIELSDEFTLSVRNLGRLSYRFRIIRCVCRLA